MKIALMNEFSQAAKNFSRIEFGISQSTLPKKYQFISATDINDQ